MNRYLAVIGDQKKYLVYGYTPAQAQEQIETLLSGYKAQDAQRHEYQVWVAGGKKVEKTNIGRAAQDIQRDERQEVRTEP